MTTPSNLPHPAMEDSTIFCGCCSKQSSFVLNPKHLDLLLQHSKNVTLNWLTILGLYLLAPASKRTLSPSGNCNGIFGLIHSYWFYMKMCTPRCLQVHILFSAPCLVFSLFSLKKKISPILGVSAPSSGGILNTFTQFLLLSYNAALQSFS